MTFEELAKVNVNPHIEKKNGLSYLSWAWAVDYMTRLDPEATWEYREFDGKPFLTLPGGTCLVYCTVTFGGRQRTCHLPVMDYRNKPIENPNAFEINTTMQRALVKAIALHGLGLYIYAGEDLPKDEADAAKEDKKHERIEDKIIAAGVTPNAGAGESLTPEQKKRVQSCADEVNDAFGAGFPEAAFEAVEAFAFDNDEKLYLWSLLGSKERNGLKKLAKAKQEKLKEMGLATQP
jgi:hypothetical protein